jgi:quinol monooxygenase YgiN
MHANMRQYRISPDQIDTTMHLVDTELAERLSQEPGFVAYELMAADDGSICSMTIFEDREGAERSQALAAEFVHDHLAGIEIKAAGSMLGEVMVSRARERVLEAAHH